MTTRETPLDEQALDDLVERSTANPFNLTIQRVLDRALSVSDVRRVYGDPIREGDRTVVPVAQVKTMFGFGGGSGSGPEQTGGEGGGGGGSVQVRPIGYLEISPLETRFVPIVDQMRLALTAIITLALVVILVGRRRRS